MVTLDADGQNDPGEIETMLAPVVDGEADFVVASRRLGVDETEDGYRKNGVVVFAWMVNLLVGTHLTDTSNGYRRCAATMLADVAPRLEQDQYQTSELLITARARGLAGRRAPDRLARAALGDLEEGRQPPLRLPLRHVMLRTWRRSGALTPGGQTPEAPRAARSKAPEGQQPVWPGDRSAPRAGRR